ncbi:glutathione S-transferase domain protein [Vibrio maritimus]|uniref:Glutathione S-transferase domain protein n=1 Tax=Vibrio maritimus TaxID=990268 RepID=A0A090SS84_9VIBR|nr:glutathione S-transferase domain protein [Vibrio maritimus]
MDSEIGPILYSLHNCPFAIRARLAIIKAQLQVRIRAIKLDNKPFEMLEVSPKGTVPVLAFEDGKPVIEQS